MIQLVFKIIIVFLMVLICNGCPNNCDDYHKEIIVVNKSHQDIALTCWALGCQWDCDGTGTMILDKVGADSLRILKSPARDCGWESSFANELYLNFLITDYATYKQYWNEPRDTICKYLPILQCYQLSLEDLQQINWTISYPPDERMKDVKMFPPYGKD